MIDFSKAYNRADFVNYLRRDFLPDDFEQEEKNVPFWSQMNYASVATCLGKSKTLNLVVYEIKHRSPHDARVGLSKDAFRMLAGEKQNRALVIFVPEDNSDNYRFSLIEIQLSIGENDSNVTRTYSNPRRYSYYLGKGIACYTPNKYLNELGRVKDVKDLFERFSVEVLTKAFYQELSDWYAWAIKVISFPNDISTRADDKLHNHEGVIRLITRLIFVWFLKERKLIPWQFFDQEYIANHLIKGFNPHKIDNLFGKSEASVYYRAILQNLFFAMLNCPITKEGSTEFTERRFKDNRSQFDDNKLMRYRDEFNNPDEFLRLANETVPFLNGGLFDCLDEKRSGMYYDGFPSLEGKSVLDLGCGYGWHCKFAEEQGATKILGIDLSKKMIEEAQKRNSGNQIEYRISGLEEYDYPENEWDCVISNLALHYIEDIVEIFQKVYRTLKPGGIFLFNIEHPVFTAGVGQDWIYTDDGKPQYWAIDNYFITGERNTHFLGCDVVKQHHTLTQIIMGLLNNGFELKVVEEAEPPKEMMDIPGMEDELRRPMMLLVKAIAKK